MVEESVPEEGFLPLNVPPLSGAICLVSWSLPKTLFFFSSPALPLGSQEVGEGVG